MGASGFRHSAVPVQGNSKTRSWARRLTGVAAAGTLMGGLLVVVTAGTATAVSLPTPPAGATFVSNHSGADAVTGCAAPSFTSIQAAVTAASANATIYVCAGTYNESVSIAKPLTLDGAEFGVDARTRSGVETIIDGSGGVSYVAGATSGTLNGFTLNGYTGGTGEVQAANVGSAWNLSNNVVDVSNGGYYLDTDGLVNPSPSTISQNEFVQATLSSASSGDFGQAVLLWANTSNNVTISNNAFDNLSGPGAGINTTGTGTCSTFPDTTNLSNDLTISGNSFTDNGAPYVDPAFGAGLTDENFVAMFCTSGAQIDANTVTITDANDGGAETPIYLGGGNWNSVINANSLTGNGASNASGINLNSDFYPPGTGVSITSNTVSGFLDGIHVRDGEFGAPGGGTSSDFTISGNQVTNSSSFGIDISDGSNGTVDNNSALGSTTEDCEDASTGTGTAGTADSWVGDTGQTSSPAGLCQSSDSVTSTPANSTITLGQAGNDLATISGNAVDGSPTGAVSFYECGPTTVPTVCSSTSEPVGSAVAVSAAPGHTATATSLSFTPTATGYWCFNALYSGSAAYVAGQDNRTSECVDVTASGVAITTTPTNSSVALSSSNTDGATLTGNATGGSPTGTVNFFECGPNPAATGCTPGAQAVGTAVALVPGAGNTATAASPSFIPSSAGTWCFAISYNGDSNYSSQFQGGGSECFTVAHVATSTATTPTLATIALGSSDTDTAKVTGTAVGGSPTGSVSFYECGPTTVATPCTSTTNAVGSPVALTAGAANTATALSASFTPTSTGFWCFAGVYSGDGDYSSSQDTTSGECVNVTKASTATLTTPTHTTVVVGGSNTDQVTVTGNATGGSPTGSVTFYQCGSTTVATACTSTANPIGSAVNLTAGTGNTATATSPSFTPTGTGFWCFAGVYSGDSNYTASSDTTVDECFSVTKGTTTTHTVPTHATVVLGSTNTDGVTVTGSASPGSPTGTVSFYQCGPTTVATTCSSTTHQVGTAVALTPGASGSSAATSASFTPTATGFWCFAAVYSGDANYQGSMDTTTTECFTVTAATSTTASAPTSTTVPLGNTNTDVATVTGNTAGGSPTGTVTFYQCGPTTVATACTSTAHQVGSPVTLVPGASNTASATSPSFMATATGFWCFGAVYSGDTNYGGSSDTTTAGCFHVTSTTSTTVTTPTNSTLTLGQADTDLATVTGNAAGGSPTGTVSFFECGPTATATPCTSTTHPVGSAVALTAGASNTATATSLAFTPTATGFWCFTANYSGDGNYFASSDTTTDECVNVVASGNTFTTSAPTTASFVLGGSDTDNATVTGNAAGGSPTGTVSFFECGPTATATPCSSTAHQVGTAVAVAAGASNTATATSASFTPTAAGFWCFAADYSGGASYFSSSDASTDECFDVTAASTAITTVPTASTILLGASNTDLVAVTGNAGAGAPAGTVSFYACGPSTSPAPCTSTTTAVGSPVHLTAGSGNASTATSASFTPTSTGTWCFAGVYSGSSAYLTSSDTTTDECFHVTAGSTATTSLPTQSTIVTGSSDSDSVTVTGNGAGGSPTGTVQFYECGPTTTATACTSTTNPVGTAVALAAGASNTATASSISFTPSATGFWCFASVYSGNAQYLGSSDQSTGECVDVMATAAGLEILTTSLPPATVGTPYSATISASGGKQPYHWSATKMPPGIGFNKLTGVIAGTPKRKGTFTVTIRVKDSTKPHHQKTSQVLTLTVS
jgi:parallel beta-helix repeat protein